MGHAGTLDPMATGVLVLGVGRSTKLLTYVVGTDKTYLATIRLGQATITDDAEGDVTAARSASEVSPAAIAAGIAALTGNIEQVPSAVSAIKVDGVRSYARVRGGEAVQLAARPITVTSFELLARRSARAEDGTDVLDLDVSVTCSSGTYIRALARDLGSGLGVGGHLTALRRTRVGRFLVDDAVDVDEATRRAESQEGLASSLMAPARAAAAIMNTRPVSLEEATDLGHGRWIAPSGSDGPIAAIGPEGTLLAILTDTDRRGEERARPAVVFS